MEEKEKNYTIYNLDDTYLKEECQDWNFQGEDSTPEMSIDFSNSLNMTREKLNGIGLAANQVGYKLNIISVKGFDSCFFNPRIVSYSDETSLMEEGCLSFPGLIVKVRRPVSIRIRFADCHGEVQSANYGGMTSRIIQHEVDHLKGILYYNRANRFHREQAFRKWKH